MDNKPIKMRPKSRVNKPHKPHKHTNKSQYNFLTAQDRKSLNIISKVIKDKVKDIIEEHEKETGEKINHVSINYFNTSALSKPTAMNTVDYIAHDEQHNINYLCMMVYFGEHQLNTMTAHTMMKFLSDKHVWRKSTTPNEPSLDLNGVIITDYNPVKAGLIKLDNKQKEEDNDNA